MSTKFKKSFFQYFWVVRGSCARRVIYGFVGIVHTPHELVIFVNQERFYALKGFFTPNIAIFSMACCRYHKHGFPSGSLFITHKKGLMLSKVNTLPGL